MNLSGVLSLMAASKLPQTITHGMRVSIEHPKGSMRVLKDNTGKVVYKKHMYAHYGFINNTKGRDGDDVDCFIGPLKNASEVFIVHMKDMGPVPAQREDEDKCFIGYPSADAAKQAFLMHYPKNFYESMTAMPLETFKRKMKRASLPYREKKIHAGVKAKQCPHCGSKKFKLMPTDFETAKCSDCKKNFHYGDWSSKEVRATIALAAKACPHCGSKKFKTRDMRFARCSECQKPFNLLQK